MSSTTLAGEQLPPLRGAAMWGAAMLLALANFLAILDMSIANVSVPNIAGSLGASPSQGTWVITSYAVAEAITVPLSGWLAGRFGAVRTFVFSIIGFAVCSALCGLAPSLGMLVMFRVLQGMFGGPLMPLSQTLMMTLFPPEKRGATMALWGITTLIAPVMGPNLGGLLCDNFGWPAIFWVNVPIALICLPFLVRLLIPRDTAIRKVRVDTVGLGLLIVWVGALQLMFDLGKDHEWFESSLIVGLAVVAAVGFAAFVIWELTEPDPIVNLRVLRHRSFSIILVIMALVFGAFFASNVLTPLWLQTNMGYTATWAGYVAGMFGILSVISAPISSQLATRIDPRPMISIGIGWLAFATVMRANITTDMGFWDISVWMLVAGVGMPMFFMPINMVALGSVDPEETAGAAGLLSFVRTVSGAFATSLVNTTWENSGERNHAALAGVLNGGQAAIDSLVQAGQTTTQALSMLDRMVQIQAVTLATSQVFLICAAVFGLSAGAIWLVPRPKREVDASAVH
jgi:DHA2 family multidrug resistance protein